MAEKGGFAKVILLLFGMILFFASAVRSDTGSCRIKQQGKIIDCMEFTGERKMLPAMERACTAGHERAATWVAAPCPLENAVSQCTETEDNLRQVSYCYQKYAKMPLDQRLDYCKKTCKGTFLAMGGAESGSATSEGTSVADPAAPLVAASKKPRSAPSRDCSGKWSTSEGEMTLVQTGDQVKGNYTADNGELFGTLRGTVLDAYWVEDDAQIRCKKPIQGRYFWGRVIITFTGSRFIGRWGHCEGPLDGAWKGFRK
jgi:hypothetical protein